MTSRKRASDTPCVGRSEHSSAPQAMTANGDNDTSAVERLAGRQDMAGTGWNIMFAPSYMILVDTKTSCH